MRSIPVAAKRSAALAEPSGKATLELRAERSFGSNALETNITTERAVLVREGAGRAVRVEEREAHRFACALFDGARAPEVVEVRRGEAGARRVHLDARATRARRRRRP